MKALFEQTYPLLVCTRAVFGCSSSILSLSLLCDAISNGESQIPIQTEKTAFMCFEKITGKRVLLLTISIPKTLTFRNSLLKYFFCSKRKTWKPAK